MSAISDVQVAIVLPYYEARAIMTAANREAKDRRRTGENFVAPPGKINKALARAETLESAVARVDAAIEIALDGWKESRFAQE